VETSPHELTDVCQVRAYWRALAVAEYHFLSCMSLFLTANAPTGCRTRIVDCEHSDRVKTVFFEARISKGEPAL
jgi:hypothetical protein